MQKILQNIYNYKAELMGLSILFVLLNHSPIPDVFGFKATLRVGVDMFLLIGAFTCTLSFDRTYQKCVADSNEKESFKIFYKKRFLRILPSYLILFSLYYAWLFLIEDDFNVAGYFRTFTFWINIADNDMRLWYIPVVLVGYLLLPFYFLVCKKYKIAQWAPLVVTLGLIVLCTLHICRDLPFYMFWVRLPIFLLGILIYLHKDSKIEIKPAYILATAFLFWVFSLMLDIPYYYNLSRICSIPVVLCIIYFYDKFKIDLLKKAFGWLGLITLEIYMFNDILMREIVPMVSSQCESTSIATLAAYILYFPVGIALAYAYNKLMKLICR